MLKSTIEHHLRARHGPLLEFWTEGGAMPETSLEAHCDMIYSLFLLGRAGEIPHSAIDAFLAFLGRKNLPGWSSNSNDPKVLVHNCAYAFGALNLLSDAPAPYYDEVLGTRTEAIGELVDSRTLRPVFPSKWAHHSWRVSHWIGGVPSIVLSLARSGYAGADRYAALLAPVRNAVDALLDPQTGLLRTYNSALLQTLFRKAYALRHDPDLGDVGGVAHILWVDHVIGRKYVALPSILAQSQALFRGHSPFMEQVPYCLDFDVVQIVRTGLDQTSGDRGDDGARARAMMADIEQFFAGGPNESYSLHKVPGALAAYHECALIAEVDPSAQLGTRAIDIIARAFWL